MPTIEIRRGAQFSIHAWGNAEYCALLEFLEAMENEAKADLQQLTKLFNLTAEQGVIKNKEKCRPLKEGIFEFKANQLRVLWFYDQNRIIICSHGFKKKSRKPPAREIERALKIKAQYFAEQKGRRSNE